MLRSFVVKRVTIFIMYMMVKNIYKKNDFRIIGKIRVKNLYILYYGIKKR